MNHENELTTEEKELLATHLNKFEKNAHRSKKWRYSLLGAICILLLLGIDGISPAIKNATSKVDKQQIIDMLSNEEIPEDVTENNWIVGYVNKTVIMSAHQRKIQSFELFLAIIGALELTAAMITSIFLARHWNDGKRDSIIAKLMHNYLLNLKEEVHA